MTAYGPKTYPAHAAAPTSKTTHPANQIANLRTHRDLDRGGRVASGTVGGMSSSNVEVAHVQRVVFDELPARFNHVAHQDREHLVGADGVVLVQIDA